MKGLVLAGGAGTRLRPLTHTSAKQLVPVANKPVLAYGLEALRDAGISQVGVVVGDTAAEIQAAVGDGSDYGLAVTYIRQEAPLGLAHAVKISRDFLGADRFVMYLGDNFIVGGITGVVERFRAAPECDASILLTRVHNPSDFGVADLDAAGAVVRLEEKPAQPRSDLALVGVYLFGPRIHEAVAEIKPSRRGELEITDAIQWLLDHDADVRSHIIEGYWKDTGNVTDMLEVNRTVLETLEPDIAGDVDADSQLIGRVVVAEGAVVRNSRIVGPVVIGAGAVIDHCYVGPFTSLGRNVQLRDTEIEYSIVLDDSSISGVGRIEASLIGKEVEVTAASRPQAHRLILGDHSQVRINR